MEVLPGDFRLSLGLREQSQLGNPKSYSDTESELSCVAGNYSVLQVSVIPSLNWGYLTLKNKTEF